MYRGKLPKLIKQIQKLLGTNMYLRVPSNPNCFETNMTNYITKRISDVESTTSGQTMVIQKKNPTPPKLSGQLQGFVYPNDKTTPNQRTGAILHHGKKGRWPQINSSEIGGGRWKTRRRPFLHSCDEWPLPLARFLFVVQTSLKAKLSKIHCF